MVYASSCPCTKTVSRKNALDKFQGILYFNMKERHYVAKSVGKHYDLARKMCNYWANFIRSGNPNGKDADGNDMPLWKPFTEDEPYRIFFCDEVTTSNKGPDDLMKFLIRQYLKADKIMTDNRYQEI